MDRYAANAAGFVVDADFAKPAAERRLLRMVEPDTTDPAAVRAQLSMLQKQILGEEVGAAGPVAFWHLWSEARALGGPPADAWKVVISAMLQDPRMLFD
jgi:hypothetical protein